MVRSMTEAELAKLDDPDAPNVPARMPEGHGPRDVVPVEQQRERRAVTSGMLAQGAGADAIVTALGSKYAMSPRQAQDLVTEVRAMWDDEDAEAARYARGAARRRLMQSIREANKDRKFTAVANLEKVLADVEGTNAKEEEQPIDVDSRLTEAVLHQLQLEDTKGLRIIIESQRSIIELGARDGTVQPKRKLKPGETIVEPRGV